jgi:DNA-binding NtrC family response regulator
MAVDVMIVDDDAGICRMLSMFVREIGYTVSTVESGEKAINLLPQATPRLILLDFMLPDIDGLQVLQRVKQDNAACKVVMMSGYNTAAAAVQAIQLGAETYLTKPTPLPELGLLIDRLLEDGRQEPAPDSLKLEGVIGRSPAMQEVYRQVHRVAGSRATVLIRGASGTGKDLIAQAIHGLSAAANKSFVRVDCTNIPHNLIETELFGRKAPSGTGQRKKGLLEKADWGTLFLDEIGLMPLDVQGKLLNLLETYRFQQVGGNQHIPVSVRILAATNDDLEKAVGENRFREDLYYRLNVVPIDLPELRQRGDDISLLTEHFLEECAAQYNTEPRHLDLNAQALLQSYPGVMNLSLKQRGGVDPVFVPYRQV